MANESTFRVLSSGRKLEVSSSVHRVLKSGRCVSDNNEPVNKKQRTLYSQIGTILHDNKSNDNYNEESQSRTNEPVERKQRENEPTKKLLLQAVSDANKSVLMKLNKTNGVVKVVKPDGTIECVTAKKLAKRLKAKEPTWIDTTSLDNKIEPAAMGKMKICIQNDYCSTTDDDKRDDNDDNKQRTSSMEFEDDEEDEFVVVVNNDYETGDELNNVWMVNDYPYCDNAANFNTNEYDEGRGNGTFKRKLSDDNMSDDNDQQQQQQYSPPMSQSTKKPKRCRFWPDCHNGDQCEFVHPTQRCTHFPNCAYGAECLNIHPPCRFGSACVRQNCPYLHSLSTPASSPSSSNNNAATLGRTSTANRLETSVVCKFGMQCMRPDCMYAHPRMPLPFPRNYKWINNKWRASDDAPLLPPTPKTIVYENPFVNDKTLTNKDRNSNQDEFEK